MESLEESWRFWLVTHLLFWLLDWCSLCPREKERRDTGLIVIAAFVYPPKLETFLSSFAAPAVNILLETAASPKFFPPTHNLSCMLPLCGTTQKLQQPINKTHRNLKPKFQTSNQNSHLPKETPPKFSLHLFFPWDARNSDPSSISSQISCTQLAELVGLSSGVSVDFVTQCWYPWCLRCEVFSPGQQSQQLNWVCLYQCSACESGLKVWRDKM